ncbi:MAG: MarR family winged helix-turn-helix transcriptional regulator, partial [Solirubrobacteraceae bacterium]
FKLDGALAMKELAQRLGCDASFVSTIADYLERRGFVRRAPSQRDRRIKNLVLTPDGLAAKERLMGHLAAKMPWCYALDDAERQCLLGLLRKMLDAPVPEAGADGAPGETKRDNSNCGQELAAMRPSVDDVSPR